jgi:hypothetical protein
MISKRTLRARLAPAAENPQAVLQTSARFRSKLDSPKSAKESARTMSKSSKHTASQSAAHSNAEQLIRVRVKALEIPPIKDGIVIGRDAAIGGEAMVRTLRLMTNEKFERFTLPKDDIVTDVILRTSVVRKLGKERVLKFVMDRIKPVMTETELLMLDIDIELVIEDTV